MNVTVHDAGAGFPAADGWTAVVRLEPEWAARELPPVPVPVSVRGFCPSYLARLRTWLRPLVEPSPTVQSAVAEERDAMLPVFGSPERTLAGFAWLAETAVRAAGWSGWPPSASGELEAAVHVPGGETDVRWSAPDVPTDTASESAAAATAAPSSGEGQGGEASLLDLLARSDLGSPPAGGEPVTMDVLKAAAGELFPGEATTGGGPERPLTGGEEGGTAVVSSASPYLLTLGLRLAYNELLTVYAAWLESTPVRTWFDEAPGGSRRLASLLYEPQPAWPDRPLVATVTRDDRVELRPLPPFPDFARRSGADSLDRLLAGALEDRAPTGTDPDRWRSFLAERAEGRPPPPPVGGAASDDGPSSGLRADLTAVIAESAELTDDELRAVADRAWYGLEFDAIAERSGRPEGRLRRAYLSGRRRLTGAEPLLELLR